MKIKANIFRMIRDMDNKELNAYITSVATRLSASIDLGGRSLDGKVVFSKGLAWEARSSLSDRVKSGDASARKEAEDLIRRRLS